MFGGQFGPVGGTGGSYFQDYPPEDERIAALVIGSGAVIDSIQVIGTRGGSLVVHPRHGGSGGASTTFALDSDEFIHTIFGYWSSYLNFLSIVTNKKNAHFGTPSGSFFEYDLPLTLEVATFFGYCGTYIDSLGIFSRIR